MTILFDDKNNSNKDINAHSVKKNNENTTAKATEYDSSYENNIRPKFFRDYIGQEALKETLKISIEAAKLRSKVLDHVLLYGPPGLGKTTLAGIVANETGTGFKVTSAPSLERPRDIIGILMSLKQGDVLFIDEIHRLNKVAEEILYSAMEDFSLDMTTGKSQSVKAIRIPLPQFTLIGATTKAGSLSGPLRDRFGIIHRLEFYTTEELVKVIQRTAGIINVEISSEASEVIALCSRGTPRVANRLIKRVSDYALVKSEKGKIEKKIAQDALKHLNIDEFGLDNTDRTLLKLIVEKYQGGPVGIETLAVALSEDTKTIEDVYEPYLVQKGFLERTPRGRKITSYACRCLKLKADFDGQQSLF